MGAALLESIGNRKFTWINSFATTYDCSYLFHFYHRTKFYPFSLSIISSFHPSIPSLHPLETMWATTKASVIPGESYPPGIHQSQLSKEKSQLGPSYSTGWLNMTCEGKMLWFYPQSFCSKAHPTKSSQWQALINETSCPGTRDCVEYSSPLINSFWINQIFLLNWYTLYLSR